MKLLVFCLFGLKVPIHTPKIGFWGDFTPKMGSNINETSKRHTLTQYAGPRHLSHQAWKSVDGSDL